MTPRAGRALLAGRQGPVLIGLWAGVGLILILGATTSLFASDPDGSAYEAGFEAGFEQAAAIPDNERTRLEAVAYARGLRAVAEPAVSGLEIVRLAALFAVTSALAQPDPYEAGFAEGLRAALEGRPAQPSG